MMWDLSGGNARKHHHQAQNSTTAAPTSSYPFPQPNNTQNHATTSYLPVTSPGGPTMSTSYMPQNDGLQSYIQTSRGTIVYPSNAQVIQIPKSKHRSKKHSKHHHSSSSRPQMIFISGSSPAVPQVHQHTSHVPQPQVSPVYLHQTQSQPQFLTTPSASFPQPSIPQALAAPDFHQADGQALQSVSFEYSRCTGRRKALCIGINYLGQPNELRGCINDAKRVRDFLYRYHRYSKGDIVLLTDDASDPRRIPTRENIIDAMRWLVRSAKQDDSLFFHYSGHGGQTPDLDGDEVDGYDETIFPVDYQQAGQIIDDTMHEIMVKPLPRGCRLTALFDCCHSGSALDLPYIYSSSGRLKGSHVTSRAQRRKYSPADVISFSGCEDGQTSADTFAGGVAVGAMSHAFMTSLRNHPKQSYHGLLRSVREILYPQYSQKPQLASSHPIDTGLEFVF